MAQETGAEKVLTWMEKFYEVNGTPNYGEIISQLQMAIDEESQNKEPRMVILLGDAHINHPEPNVGEIVYDLPHDRVVTLWNLEGDLVARILKNDELVSL